MTLLTSIIKGEFLTNKSTLEHYELLIEEGTDVVNDPPILRNYMNRWTGDEFYELLDINGDKDVLEIGVGTGRIAIDILSKKYKSFTGIDLSKATIARAKVNLKKFKNVDLITKNVNDYNTDRRFDVIYSVLTFIHIENKLEVLNSLKNLLNSKGAIILALDYSNKTILDYGTRTIEIYPNIVDDYIKFGEILGFREIDVIKRFDGNEMIGFLVRYQQVSQ